MNSYFSNKKRFNGLHVQEYLLGPAFIDAYDICYSNDRWKSKRNIGELFHSVFIGKLGEHIVAEYFRNKGYRCYRPDYYTNNLEGDRGDLILQYNNKTFRFSIKTCVDYGNLLVERCDHYNNDGIYINKGNNILFDRHYLVRVNQNIKNINYNLSKEGLFYTIKSLNWKYEITGYITHDQFLQVIRNNQIVPKGDLHFTSNSYFVRTGDLIPTK